MSKCFGEDAGNDFVWQSCGVPRVWASLKSAKEASRILQTLKDSNQIYSCEEGSLSPTYSNSAEVEKMEVGR